MRVAVDVPKPLHAYVSIDLGRGQGNVTEEFLNGPEVRSTFQKMGCERVPQGVRREE